MSEVDFDGYLNEQLSAEPAADEPVEAVAEETPEASAEVARDESGRFKAADTDETPEPEVAAEPEPELILGKYKTTEDALKALEHSQREIGRLGQELGELRQQVSKPDEPRYDLSDADEADDPATAQAYAVHALRQGDEIAYRKALGAWAQMDQVGAMDFHARRISAEQEQRIQAQLGPSLASANQIAERESLGEAVDGVLSRHTDFAEVIGSLDEARVQEIVANGFPTQVLAGLNGSTADKTAVFETLYRWVKSERADQTAAVTKEQTEQTLAQKAQAVVASASTSNVETADESPRVTIPGYDGTLDEFHKMLSNPSPTSWHSRGGQ